MSRVYTLYLLHAGLLRQRQQRRRRTRRCAAASNRNPTRAGCVPFLFSLHDSLCLLCLSAVGQHPTSGCVAVHNLFTIAFAAAAGAAATAAAAANGGGGAY